MPEKKKLVKFPADATQELDGNAPADPELEKWEMGTVQMASRLGRAEWHSFNSRPRVDATGYFVVLHWYSREKQWVPLYLQRGQVGAMLTRLFASRQKETTPIGKYLSSFPHSQRKLLWLKWVLDSPADAKETMPPLKDVLEVFSIMYNHREILPFNVVDDQTDVPDNFSLLD